MKTNPKLERIRERRNKVYFVIKFRAGEDTISFDEVVKGVNSRVRGKNRLSRNEIAHHIAVLTRKGKIGNKDKTHFYHHRTFRDAQRSFNEFVYGCANPVHIFGVGYINPHSRYGRRFLDP